jgi:hypothetical protein
MMAEFYAWCDEVHRVDALAEALAALASGGQLRWLDMSPGGDHESMPMAEAIAAIRRAFMGQSCDAASFHVALPSGRFLDTYVVIYGEQGEISHPWGPMRMFGPSVGEWLPSQLTISAGKGARSIEVQAAVACLVAQPDIEHLLLGLCASPHVPAGACAADLGWDAPVECGATYHADAAAIARDLALSWIHLHEGARIERAAGLPLDLLRVRVESAPEGARIPILSPARRLEDHFEWKRRGVHPDKPRPRVAVPGYELSREEVLAAMSTPPAKLLEALEAAAASPDETWRAVEPLARNALAAAVEGAPTSEVDVSTPEHFRFLQEHAPFHVRRLPNGGVLLATHPYRTLWPLWSAALMRLGIRS